MLEKKDDNMINDWKSYPGLALIITMAREVLDTGKTTQIEKLTKLMHTIAILIGEKVNSNNHNISKECSRAISDMVLWDTKVITSQNTWPSRYYYSFIQLFSDPKENLRPRHWYMNIWEARPVAKWNNFLVKES